MNTAANTSASPGSLSVSRLLARKGGTAFVLNAVGMLLAFALQVVLARRIGASSYGRYSYVMTVVTFLVFPAKLGFDTAIVRYVAAYRAEQAWGEAKGLLRRANQWTLGLSAAVAALGFAVLWGNAAQMDGELARTFWIGLSLVPLLALATLRQSALQALNEVLYAQSPEKILRPVLLIGCLYAAIYAGNTSADAPLAMALFGVSLLASYILGAWVLRRKTAPLFQRTTPVYRTREWMSTSLSLMVNAGMYLILGQLNVLMLGMMHGTYESGILSAAVRLAALVSFALTAINMTAAPLMSAAYAKGDMERLQKVAAASGAAGFVFAAGVFLLLLLFAKPILGIFGPEFALGAVPLLIMAAGQVVNAACGQTGTVLTMTGNQRTLTKALAVSAVLNASLNVLLIPAYGMTGAAVSALVSAVYWNVAMVFAVRRKLGISTSVVQAITSRKRGQRP